MRIPGRSAAIALISSQKDDSNQTRSQPVTPGHSQIRVELWPIFVSCVFVVFQNFSLQPSGFSLSSNQTSALAAKLYAKIYTGTPYKNIYG